MRNYIAVACFWLLPALLVAQQNWEAGMIVGGTGYQGDLNPEDYPLPAEADLFYGAFVRRHFSPIWALRLQALRGDWTGSSRNLETPARRDFSFTNTLSSLHLQVEWDPFGRSRFPDGPYARRPRITPFGYAGIGAAHYSLQTQPPGDTDSAVRELLRQDLEDVEDINLEVFAGGGLKIDLGKRSSLGLEGGPRYGFNDLLDGFSAQGNPDSRDWYWHVGAAFSVRLGPGDADGDGVVDDEDTCQFLAGSIAASGCPDRDEDGVEDAEDVCPDRPGPMLFSGCPDTDGDSIMDPSDLCPFQYGLPETEGCPDSDQDGIRDAEDKCPDSAGLPRYAGCADRDGDSIPDPQDGCPGKAGLVANGGCPLPDTDCDGIVDALDRCPLQADTTGFTGCPDADEDGVVDIDDRCPDQPGAVATSGCPELDTTEQELLTLAARDVRFRTGSAELLADSKAVLRSIVEILNKYMMYHLSMRGHTDNVGRVSTNQTLSERRARACMAYLIDQGIAPERLQAEGFGESQPVGDNSTAAGRRENRRVEFDLYLPDATEPEEASEAE